MRLRRRLVQDVGVNDAPFPVPSNDPFYRFWVQMLFRCYGKPGCSNAAYRDCSVSEEWHSFMNFRSWILKQDWEGNQLDKDLIVPGNRIYSPEFCCLVPRPINMLPHRLNEPNVALEDRGKPWGARINFRGKHTWLGQYETREEAVRVWKLARAKNAEQVLHEYRQTGRKIDDRVCEAIESIIRNLREVSTP